MDIIDLGRVGAGVWFDQTSADPNAMRAMTEAQMKARDALMWAAMAPAQHTLESALRAQNVVPRRRPTMTLAEWDAARAAFAPSHSL